MTQMRRPHGVVGGLVLLLVLAIGSHASARHHHGKSRARTHARSHAAEQAPAPVAQKTPPPVQPLTILQVFAVENEPQPVPASQLLKAEQDLEALAPNDPRRADALYQLARLHLVQERYYRYTATSLRARRLLREGHLDAAEQASMKQKVEDADLHRNQWLLSATDKFSELTGNAAYKSYPNMDKAIVSLISLYMLQKREPEARPLVKRLLDEFPHTKSMPDAYLAFAEYFFDLGDWDKSLSFYQRMLKFPDSPRYGYARYKEAWSYFEKGNYQQAMQSFVMLIPRPKPQPGAAKAAAASSGDVPEAAGAGSEAKDPDEDSGTDEPSARSRALLVREARKAAVWTYAQAGKPDEALRFFTRIGGRFGTAMMEELSRDYAWLGKHAEAMAVLRALADASPDSSRRCVWQEGMLREGRAIEGRLTPEMLKALQEIVELSNKERAARKAAAGSDDDEAAGGGAAEPGPCRQVAKSSLRWLAEHWDALMDGTDDATWAAAAPLYKAYLDDLSAPAERYDLQWNWASGLAARRDYCGAVRADLVVFRADPSDKAAHRDQAAGRAVEAWERCRRDRSASLEVRAAVASDFKPDAVAVFHDGGKVRKAAKFFRGLDPEGAADLLGQLADLYEKDGRARDAKKARSEAAHLKRHHHHH